MTVLSAATNVAASVTAMSGTPQSATVGKPFDKNLVVMVRDSVGMGVSGVTVVFSAPAYGAGAVLSSSVAVTNGGGLATVTATANGVAGNYTVMASVGSASGEFSLTNLAAAGGGGGTTPATNIALGKTATQSSSLAGYPASAAGAAVDGNTDGSFFNGSVSTTDLNPSAWWQVDLGGPAVVNSIMIFNRTDCCGPRLSDYWVFVSDTPFAPTDTPANLQFRAGTWGSHQTTAPGPSATIAAGVSGRYVRVQLSGTDYLTLAEVQVMGTGGSGPTPARSDLAQGKPASQSSVFPGYPSAAAGSAVDGNTDGSFFHNSVTATNPDVNAWWQVDLGASVPVGTIAIWNRTDCCASRLSDYWVFASNTPFLATDTPASLQGRPGTAAFHVSDMPAASTTLTVGGQPARYVRVQLAGADYLSLAEVQVFGQ